MGTSSSRPVPITRPVLRGKVPQNPLKRGGACRLFSILLLPCGCLTKTGKEEGKVEGRKGEREERKAKEKGRREKGRKGEREKGREKKGRERKKPS